MLASLVNELQRKSNPKPIASTSKGKEPRHKFPVEDSSSGESTHPHPLEWDLVKYPLKFKAPTLNSFDDKGSTN